MSNLRKCHVTLSILAVKDHLSLWSGHCALRSLPVDLRALTVSPVVVEVPLVHAVVRTTKDAVPCDITETEKKKIILDFQIQ